jgi:hypothetical protein
VLVDLEGAVEDATEAAARTRTAAPRVRVETGAAGASAPEAERVQAAAEQAIQETAARVFQAVPPLPELQTPVQRAQARIALRAGLATRLQEYEELFGSVRRHELAFEDLREFQRGLDPAWKATVKEVRRALARDSVEDLQRAHERLVGLRRALVGASVYLATTRRVQADAQEEVRRRLFSLSGEDAQQVRAVMEEWKTETEQALARAQELSEIRTRSLAQERELKLALGVLTRARARIQLLGRKHPEYRRWIAQPGFEWLREVERKLAKVNRRYSTGAIAGVGVLGLVTSTFAGMGMASNLDTIGLPSHLSAIFGALVGGVGYLVSYLLVFRMADAHVSGLEQVLNAHQRSAPDQAQLNQELGELDAEARASSRSQERKTECAVRRLMGQSCALRADLDDPEGRARPCGNSPYR